MRFQPQKNKKGRFLALFCLLFGGFGVVFAFNPNFYFSTWFYIPSFFLIMLGLEAIYRYELTVFTYILGEKDLVILKKAGKKEECVCNLPLNTALAIVKLPKRKMKKKLEKEYGKIAVRYNFAQTACPKHAYSILFEMDKRVAEIVFEPNEEMALALSMHIRKDANIECEYRML